MKLLELVEKLVSFKTVSPGSSTSEIADFISNYCEGAGFTVEQYHYVSQGKNKVNVIARKGGLKSRLFLSGHMDTVSPGNTKAKKGWQTDPWRLTPNDARYFGLGVADMKLFLAVAIKAGEQVKREGLKHPFALCFTSDEEVGCLGVKKLTQELTKQGLGIADYIVVGEPTEMVPINLHKGYMYFAVELTGKGGHASNPAAGRNVIELALPALLEALNSFRERLAQITDKRFNPSCPTMNVGVVTTGRQAAKNKIPDFCKVEFEIRPLPNQDVGEIENILKSVVSLSIQGMEGISVKVNYQRSPTLPMITSSDSEIVKTVVDIGNRRPQAVCFNTEGGWFNVKGAQTVIWGPGSIKQAHQPNEYIEQKWLKGDIVDKYALLIRRLCCKGVS